MTPTLRMSALCLTAALTAASALAAQAQPVAPAAPARAAAPARPHAVTPAPADGTTRIASDEDAQQTRENLRNILRRHSPSLADVLRLDPSLLSSDAYLAPYPDLASFLALHPEVVRNSGFFVGTSRPEWDQNVSQRSTIRDVDEMFAALLVFSGVVTFMGLVGWAIRTLVEHRRWLRVSKAQTDAHAKVMDRLTSNEDLLAYMQSPAGRRFLEAAPLGVEGVRSMGAPIGRILFSAQVGTIAAFVGMGLLFVSNRVAMNPSISEAAPFPFTAGVVMIAVGVGFLVSSGIAYALSRRLGLLEGPSSSHA
jgi:hypothetical protein